MEPSSTKNKRRVKSNNEFVFTEFTELVEEPVHFVNTPACEHDCARARAHYDHCAHYDHHGWSSPHVPEEVQV